MTASDLVRLRDDAGASVSLGEELGRGGEGTTYVVRSPDRDRYVAKLWHPGIVRDVATLSKVAEQLADGWPDPTGHRRVAAIRGLVRTENGRVVGTQLLRLDERLVPLPELLSPIDRRRSGLAVTDRWRLRLATRVADLIARVHDNGLVIGDLGPQNIAVDPRRARITLFDVDAWQPSGPIPAPRHVTEDARAPEHAAPDALALPTVQADRWSLAVAVVQILLDGRHPCDGVPADGSAHFADVRDNVNRGYSHFSARPLRAAPDTPRLAQFTPNVREQVAQAFGCGHLQAELRPAAHDWVAALRDDAAMLEASVA